MFLVYFFAILDIFVAFLLFFGSISPMRLLLAGGIYLLFKGFIYRGDVLSALDVVVGIYCLVAIFFPMLLFTLLAGVYLLFKGIYSFMG